MGSRSAGGLDETGGGPGDLALSLRWEAIAIGAYAELPGVALVLGASLPTGRAPSDSRGVLGADVTGTGHGTLSAGISLERGSAPWFVRLDLAGVLPLPHQVRDHDLRAGPGLELQVGGGVELGAGVIVALAPRLRWGASAARDGEILPGSSTLDVALGPAISWSLEPRWALQASFDTGLPLDGLGRNRALSTTGSVGVRHAIF